MVAKDYSKLGNSPSTFETSAGEIQLYPVSYTLLLTDMSRVIKDQRENAILELARRNSAMTPEVVAKTLAEIEQQVFPADWLHNQMFTPDGMQYVIYKSLLPGKPQMRIDNLHLFIPPDDWVKAFNRVLEISGLMSPKGDSPANPTLAGNAAKPTGST